MRDTYVSLQRPEGTTIASNLSVQVDQVSLAEMVRLAPAFDHHVADLFKVYTKDWIAATLLRRGDVLIDALYRDPDTITGTNTTGNYFKYRVVGRPKDYEYDHQEAYCEVVVGG